MIKYFRYPLQKYIVQGKSQNIWGIAKREFTKSTQKCTKENVNESKFVSYIFKFGLNGFGVTTACILRSHNHIVLCRKAKRISDVKSDTPELIFEWTKFFKYLYPHIWYLLLALSVSIFVIYKSHIIQIIILSFYIYRVH